MIILIIIVMMMTPIALNTMAVPMMLRPVFCRYPSARPSAMSAANHRN
jgi:hypothetical protein